MPLKPMRSLRRFVSLQSSLPLPLAFGSCFFAFFSLVHVCIIIFCWLFFRLYPGEKAVWRQCEGLIQWFAGNLRFNDLQFYYLLSLSFLHKIKGRSVLVTIRFEHICNYLLILIPISTKWLGWYYIDFYMSGVRSLCGCYDFIQEACSELWF